MSKDRLGQEGRNEPEYPKPRISSQVAPSLLFTIEWGNRGCPPNNPKPQVELDTQVWLSARDGDGRSCHPSSDIMTNSRGVRMTKALERTEERQQTPSTIKSEKPEGTDTVYTNSHMRLVEFSHVALEDSLATGVDLWLLLIPLIIKIELNWLGYKFRNKLSLWRKG